MDISVIICTWNNSKRLDITLQSLTSCALPPQVSWEIVLVNNNCTDGTDSIVAKHKKTLPINYVREPQQGLSRAKNAGLRAAQGRLVIFTDDDVKPCEGWLLEYWSAYQRNPHGYFWGGPVISDFENPHVDPRLIAVVEDYAISGFSLRMDAGEPANPNIRFISANWASPMEALKKVGDFNVNLGLNPASSRLSLGEETDVMDKLINNGLKRWYLPEACVLHFVPAAKCQLAYIGRRARAYARDNVGDFTFKKSRPLILGAPPLIYKLICVSWFSWISSLLSGKKEYKKYMILSRYLGIWDSFYIEYRRRKA